jgi:hypothetical protein
MLQRRIVNCVLATAALCNFAYAQKARPILPRDCVTVRYFSEDNSGQRAIQINPSGTQVAYLVRSPNLETNRNDIALYVASLTVAVTEQPRLVLSGDSLSQMQWL